MNHHQHSHEHDREIPRHNSEVPRHNKAIAILMMAAGLFACLHHPAPKHDASAAYTQRLHDAMNHYLITHTQPSTEGTQP